MIKRIKDLAKIQIGYQHRGQIEEDYDQSHRIIQIKDITEDRRLNSRNLYTVTPKGSPDRYLVEKGDVLFLSRGHRLYAVPILSALEDTVAAYYFFILRLNGHPILPEYLAWYIEQAPAQNFLKTQAGGSHMPMIRKTMFEQMEIDIPSRETQERILELEVLRKKEESYLKQITEFRKRLVQGICLRAARQTDNRKGASKQ